MTLFSELTNQVHFLNDLILADMVYDNEDYEQETLDFNTHLLATKSWFMRVSYANKKRYLIALLNDVRRAWTLSLLLKSIWNCRPKDAVMSICQSKVWSSYDRPPMDHNRTAMSVKTLAQSMINDRKWFLTLDHEFQALVLTDLLTVSGGPIVWEVYRRANLLYHRYRNLQLKNIMECIVVGAGTGQKKAESSPPQPPPQPTKLKSSMSRNTVVFRAQRELEAAQAEWNSKIKQIRESQKLEELEMIFTDGTKNKIWSVNRPMPEGIETVDFLQLLPGTVGKLILSYLPKADLDSYAKVNKYWAYLVDDYKSETAARHALHKNIELMQEILLVHETSMEYMLQAQHVNSETLSQGLSFTTSIRTKQNVASLRASEKSMAGFSFKHILAEKLKLKVRRQRPIRNLSELNDRLERRGAVDAHLWRWCDFILKEPQVGSVVKNEEGVLRFKDLYFPARLMKSYINIPLNKPLVADPMETTSTFPKTKRNFSNATINMPKEPETTKRYHLWSRNFSELYKVYKVPSYQAMEFN